VGDGGVARRGGSKRPRDAGGDDGCSGTRGRRKTAVQNMVRVSVRVSVNRGIIYMVHSRGLGRRLGGH